MNNDFMSELLRGSEADDSIVERPENGPGFSHPILYPRVVWGRKG